MTEEVPNNTTMTGYEEASNDQPGLFLIDPVVTFVSCDGYDSGLSLETDGAATPINLSFQYELFTADDDDVDVDAAIAEFESSLLGGVADTLGLLDCTGENRSKKGLVRGLMGEPGVVGVSSEPGDEVNDGK